MMTGVVVELPKQPNLPEGPILQALQSSFIIQTQEDS